MACTITIDATTLIATTDNSAVVVRIDVEGDTAGCDEVRVSAHDDTNGIDIGETLAQLHANGHWTASFVDGQGFSLKGVECGDKMTIVAKCSKSRDDEGCEDKLENQLPCKPSDGGCPDVTVTVERGDCSGSTHRTMTFHVTVGGSAQIQYMWNFGDGTPLTALALGSGTFTQPHSYPAEESYNANLIVVVPPGCTATPDPITVNVPACGETACPDNPRLVAERHLPRGRRERVDIDARCVPPGDYTIRVSNAYPAGTELFWSVARQSR